MEENLNGISKIMHDDANNVTDIYIDLKKVADSLQDKLRPEDTSTGYCYVQKEILNGIIRQDLSNGCESVGCGAFNEENIYRSMPCGNIDAKIMYIKKMPSRFDSICMNTFVDRDGITLSMILHKLGIKRGDVYMTNFVKCSSNKISNESCRKCAERYLRNEIANIVRPKIIVCDGISLLKLMYNTETVKEISFVDVPGQILLPDNINYGTVYEVDIRNPYNNDAFFSTKIMAAYSVSSVLAKEGADYNRCKIDLWNQLLTAINVSQLD